MAKTHVFLCLEALLALLDLLVPRHLLDRLAALLLGEGVAHVDLFLRMFFFGKKEDFFLKKRQKCILNYFFSVLKRQATYFFDSQFLFTTFCISPAFPGNCRPFLLLLSLSPSCTACRRLSCSPRRAAPCTGRRTCTPRGGRCGTWSGTWSRTSCRTCISEKKSKHYWGKCCTSRKFETREN